VPLKNLADRAAAYGIAATSVDGNDVIAVYDATKIAVDECRAGRGPCVIEVKTMRMKGHAQHDAAEYVPKAMMDYWKTQDPIVRYEKYLTEHQLLDSEKKSAIDARIERELDEDQKFAEESPMPPPELAEQGAYCEGCHTIEAKWQRPKKEVTPPASSVEAVWKVADFGAFKSPAAPEVATQAESRHGNGASSSDDLVSAETQLEKQAPLRVPFGRGPKDRSVELERRDKIAERPPRHHKPHKRRRR
jgi:hypothetical protein